jgi:hypothetical protein
MDIVALRGGLLGLCAFSFLASGASALEKVTWVSATGDDANTCLREAPCQYFSGAYAKTEAGGVINVLTSGEYGGVTIAKSIQIVAPDGVEALATYMPISAGAAGVVKLRGLTFKQFTGQGVGVFLISARAVHIENSIFNVPENSTGIAFQPSAASELYVSDTIVSDINGTGIFIAPTGAGIVKVMLDRVQVKNNLRGIHVESAGSGSLSVALRDSTISGNTQNGIELVKTSGTKTINMMIDRSASANNGAGLSVSGAGVTARIGASTITGNTRGLIFVNGGALLSYGNNQFAGNAIEGAPSGAVAPK